MWALVGDSCLAFALYGLGVSNFFEYLDDKIDGLFPSILWFSTIVNIYLCLFLVRFYPTLFIGVSLSQWCMGIKAKGSFFWKRMAGGVRVSIEILLTPFLIFDLPLFFKKRSFKEVLTYTELISYRRPLSLVGVLFLLIFFFISTITPLVGNNTLGKIYFLSQRPSEISDKDNESLDSHYFRISTKITPDRFILVPSFFIEYFHGRKKISPGLSIYDVEKDKRAYLEVMERFNFLSVIESVAKSDFLFSMKYPELYKKINKRRVSSKIPSEKIFFTPPLRDEIKRLFEDSYQLDFSSIFSHILSKGPFTKGHMLIKNRFIPKGEKGNFHVAFMSSKKNDFLQIKRKFHQKDVMDLIPLVPVQSVVLRLSGEGVFQSSLNNLFVHKDISFTMEPASIMSEKWSPLTIVDHYIKGEMTKKQRQTMEKFSYGLFDKLVTSDFFKKNKNRREQLYSIIDHFLLATKMKNKRSPGHYSKDHLKSLKLLKKTIGDKGRVNGY